MSSSSAQQKASPEQVMITLAALAANGATVRPSGETVEQQVPRILAGINMQLANTALPTSNTWRALWIGLTQDRANLAYIALNTSAPENAPEFALCLRGTVLGSAIDKAEDMNVSEVLPFAAGGSPSGAFTNILGNISQGAMEAFTAIAMGTDLLGEVIRLRDERLPFRPTFYVTGHSLGGALATTVSLHLASAGILDKDQISVYTFAAPTAGDQNFADWFNQRFPRAQCYYNQYDVVPNAWANLVGPKPTQPSPPAAEPVEYFYPKMAAKLGPEIKNMIQNIAEDAGSNIYVQPAQQPPLNTDFSAQSPSGKDIKKIADWEAEAEYQHACSTYLSLLGWTAPMPDMAPVVSGISPTQGTAGTPVTITGSHITSESVVDFGILPGIVTTPGNGGSITAQAPSGVGIVDIIVTNQLGTSAVVTADQFTYTPPA